MRQYPSKEKPQKGTRWHYVVQALLTRSLARIRPNTPPLLLFAQFAHLKLYLTTQNDPHHPSRRPVAAQSASLERRTVPTITNNLKALPSFLHRSIRTSMISGGRLKYAGPVGSRPQDLIRGRRYCVQRMQDAQGRAGADYE